MNIDDLEKRWKDVGGGLWHCGIAPEEPLPTVLLGADALIFARVVAPTMEDAKAKASFMVVAHNNFGELIDELRRLRTAIQEADRMLEFEEDRTVIQNHLYDAIRPDVPKEPA